MTQDAANIFGNYGGVVKSGYSGRGMYGNKTTAVLFEDENDFYLTLADIIERADRDECETIAEAMRNLQNDNLGKQIIYY